MALRIYLLVVCVMIGLASAPAYSDSLLVNTLSSVRDSKTVALGGKPLLSARLLADFYAQRGNQLIWTDSLKIRALLRLAEASPADGFNPEDFHADRLRALSTDGAWDRLTPVDRIAMDIVLSDALLRYVHHTRFGKLDPVLVDAEWNDRAPVPEELLIADMQGALGAQDLESFLAERFQPPFWYEALKGAFASYGGALRLNGLPRLPDGKQLAKGDRDPRVVLLRERLKVLGGDEVSGASEPPLFDESLQQAVVAFQQRFGLAADGAVGPATRAALNEPADAAKMEQIRINLERMRWLYDNLPADYLFVDVANYMGYVIRNGAVVWSTRVIVGATDAQTPMFRDSMDHVVFNPTWTVPISIQKTMGRVSARYTLVDRRTGRKASGGDASDYRRYRVVQQPGPGNALGRVKFMFPNRHSVYLHDTSSRELFGRTSRALSHGCVRVQNPVKLAEIVLDQADWGQERIERVISGNQTRYVNLDQELPVLLYYLTARADEHGKVTFRPDIYGRDQRLREAIAAPVLTARIAFSETVPTVQPVSPSAPGNQPSTTPAPPAVMPASQDGVRLTQANVSIP
jgi:L,D-transpeptidase YcbB